MVVRFAGAVTIFFVGAFALHAIAGIAIVIFDTRCAADTENKTAGLALKARRVVVGRLFLKITKLVGTAVVVVNTVPFFLRFFVTKSAHLITCLVWERTPFGSATDTNAVIVASRGRRYTRRVAFFRPGVVIIRATFAHLIDTHCAL